MGAARCTSLPSRAGARRTPLTSRLRPMRSSLQGVFWIWLLGLLAGCATTSRPVAVSYDADAGRTVYETDQMQLGDMDVATGLTKKVEFQVRVVGECRGRDCAPSQYQLAFGKKGAQPIRLPGRDVSLQIGTETMTWADPQNREVDQRTEIRSGTFARVGLTAKQLSTLANASDVHGSIGGVRFDLPYEERAPLRTLLSRLEETASQKPDSSSS